MNVKLSQAPVFYTLAEVKFNPIEQMKDYLPKLQDRLRLNGYPDFRSENKVALTIRQDEVQQLQNIRWSFSNTKRTEGYLLFSNSIVFHTTLYDSFEDFLEKLICGIEIVHDVISLSYIERTGLRYLNAISPNENETLTDYMDSALLGFSSLLKGNLKHNFIEGMTEIDNGSLVTRTIIMDNGLALAPELSPIQLELQNKFSNLKGRTATLDIDYFKTSRFDFNLNKIKEELKESHAIISDTFNSVITDHARETWE